MQNKSFKSKIKLEDKKLYKKSNFTLKRKEYTQSV